MEEKFYDYCERNTLDFTCMEDLTDEQLAELYDEVK